ncbi:MAG: N-acetylneuraminate synthase family protein [Methanoregula sp.]|jgi:sialic acid synthase SpsE|uniref:N-acetylneuraminate synthase family protein n=1 Tax=Methanoregula sp. TaxID=2052170 RepID=UPI003D0B78F1
MIIGTRNTDESPLIVAEIGNNHEGSMDNAIRLVRAAADCGVDAVKFQTYRTELFVCPADTERYARMKSFELQYPQFAELAELAHSLGMLFISTPLDLESARFLDSIVDAFKIASGDNDFFPLIDETVRTGKPVIVSTGASDPETVHRVVAYIRTTGKGESSRDIGLLHCVSCYPAPDDEVNLAAVRFLTEEFRGCTPGYSDHALGIEAAVASVSWGAKIVEKHFTLDKNYSAFRDHQLSADPAEMKEMVLRIRKVSLMAGRADKKIQDCEQAMNPLIRRSIAARSDLSAGHRLGPDDLMWIRPSSGMRPGTEQEILGKQLRHAIRRGDFFSAGDFG